MARALRLTSHFMKRPICHESQDLGYSRRQRIESRERVITFALLCGIVLGLWGCVHLLETRFSVYTFADFCEFAKAMRYIF